MSTAAISRISRAWPLAACVLASACAADDVTRAEPTAPPVASTLVGAAEDLGPGVFAAGINDAGLVVGAVPAADSGTAAFAWSAGAGGQALVGLDSAAAAPADTAFAVSAAGEIAGVSVDAAGVRRAVRWASTAAAPEALGELQPGGWSAAYGVNGAGTIVGAAEEAGESRPFAWTAGGGMVALGSEPGAALAAGESGHVVGWAGATPRAFLWTQESGMWLLPLSGGWTSAIAADVNAYGVVVGSATTAAGDERAVLWLPPFGPVPLGTLGGRRSVALGITDGGMIVGLGTTASGETHAFAWSLRSGMRDLGTLGGAASAARAVSGTGLAAGDATAADGTRHGVRWTVTEQNTAPSAALAHPDTIFGVEGQTLRFSSASTDAESDPLAHLWSFGDGRSSAVFFTRGAGAVSKRYADQGSYRLLLRVIDPSGASDTAGATVVLANVPPSAALSASPARPLEGGAYRLAASRLVDSPADLAAGLQVAFDCGNGVLTAWSRTLSHLCPGSADDDTLQVRLRVRDKDGAEAEVSSPLVISNAAPVVSVSAPQGSTVRVGAPVQVVVGFSDPGALDGPWSWRIGWADRRAESGTAAAQDDITASHVYAAPGTYTAVVNVTDRQGRSGRSTITLTVQP